MPKPVITSEDVRGAQSGELTIPADAIVTDQARELAAELKLRLVADAPAGRAEASHDARPAPALRIALGSDHAGFELKEYLKAFLADSGYAVDDLGTASAAPVDYPDFARAVAEAVAGGKAWRGVVIDAAGIGSAIAANKVPGARAALCYDRATARNSREHNDANVLTLGAHLLPRELAREVAAVWLETKFAGGRHQKRVDKISAIERHSPLPVAGSGAAPGSGAAGETPRPELVETAAQEVLRRLSAPQSNAHREPEADDAVCPGCDGRCAQSCPVKSRQVVAAGATRLGSSPGATQIPSDLAAMIDHTLLKAEASADDVRRLCSEAREYRFASVCVNLTWVALCAAELRGTSVKVCTVAGFPLGATASSVKNYEAEQALKLGAQEVDMVINVGGLKSGEYALVEQEIRALAETCHRGGAILKVILECALLTDQEKVIASRLAKMAKADFVKTSTGFGPGGATARDVEIMRLVVGPEMGVKAAGGIRTYEDLQKVLAAGATRIGASASVRIMQEAGGETRFDQSPAAGSAPAAAPRPPAEAGRY